MSSRWVVKFACAAGLAFASFAPAAGQERSATAAWSAPRTADGQPEIQGIWSEPGAGADGTNIETGFQTIDNRATATSSSKARARKGSGGWRRFLGKNIRECDCLLIESAFAMGCR